MLCLTSSIYKIKKIKGSQIILNKKFIHRPNRPYSFSSTFVFCGNQRKNKEKTDFLGADIPRVDRCAERLLSLDFDILFSYIVINPFHYYLFYCFNFIRLFKTFFCLNDKIWFFLWKKIFIDFFKFMFKWKSSIIKWKLLLFNWKSFLFIAIRSVQMLINHAQP